MKRLILISLAFTPCILHAEQGLSLSEFKAKHRLIYCNLVMGSAFQYCNSSPWSCELSMKYKSGHYAWAKSHYEEFKVLVRTPIKGAAQAERATRELVMSSLAEEARNPSVPGPFTRLVSECGIQQLEEPAPNNSFKADSKPLRGSERP